MLRNREGFTLIELLIVVVIIGILAAIALPKFGQTRERAYFSAMRSDLRNLQTAQEMYYTDVYLYKQAGTIVSTSADADLEFQASSGVTITLNTGGGLTAGQGWGATSYHAAMGTGETCSIVVGATTGSQAISCTD
ncbi:MAG TPA: prepilin-type N-terminal cleavage/methylation domain-containing protein [Longimicrobiales bacterium]|nr:prepilin-type N-terminal cleavage/methylation domain-containing protein [Longimicrobiales bacterium]